MILVTPNLTVGVVQARATGKKRQSIRLQNQGPGSVWAQRWWFDSRQGALFIPVNGTLSDLPPGPVYQGEWYAQTDTANTVLTVDES